LDDLGNAYITGVTQSTDFPINNAAYQPTYGGERGDAFVTKLNPAVSVHFNVTFSESVTGVDKTDFTLTKTGMISGPSVRGVTGGSTAYTVTVNTGTGSGAIR
jgi:Beta-propeller repeat